MEDENTYIDVEYLDEYIKKFYLSTDEVIKKYIELTIIEKEVLIRNAFNIIESLNYSGKKAVEEQETEFPRNDQTEVPESIKQAQAELALSLLKEDTRLDMVKKGVKSYRIGDLSETFEVSKSDEKLLNNEKVKNLLSKYTSGGRSVK